MEAKRGKIAIVSTMAICALFAVLMPVELVLNTDLIFEDEAKERIKKETVVDSFKNQLIVKIKHDSNLSVTGNFAVMKELVKLENELLNGSNPETSWEYDSTFVYKLQTPFQSWEDAFSSRNRSLENATKWSDVLQPPIEGGWCGNQSTDEERNAFQTTMLLLPKDATFGVACPAFPGADERLPPDSNEILWMIWLESADPDQKIVDWNTLNLWAEKVSENTEFELEAVGVNMLFQKSKNVAVNDLNSILIPSAIILIGIMYLIIRDWKVCAVTLGSVGFVITAQIGILSISGIQISIIDAIAFPIILAVAVDGAFWYCKSSRTRNEVRSLLLLAMITTLSAVSLSLFSPIKAQNTLALMMIIGVFMDWLLTRFVLEEFYISRREINQELSTKLTTNNDKSKWAWPTCLTLLAIVALVSPPGVEVFDINQFLSEDDPALDEFEQLQNQYLIASSTVTWIIVDVEGNSHADYLKLVDIQKQIGDHPSVISFETGLYETPLVMGAPYGYENQLNGTLDYTSESTEGTPILDDHRLQIEGKTTAFVIAVFIDGSNSEAALDFLDDVSNLMDNYQVESDIGGELVVGASLAEEFDKTRVLQIFAAGICVFFVSYFVTKSPTRAMRISIGTIAVGAAVDGFASLIGERGVSTAPAVLLGMGFAADYLSHASAGHKETKSDNFARWGAAITSVSLFILLTFAEFPPARQTGQLLAISILLSVILATSLSNVELNSQSNKEEE